MISNRNRYNDYNDGNETADILKEQLQIKSESILLLSQQLENSIKEKDEYKRIIDTLYDKNLTLKKRLYNEQDGDKKFSSSKQTKSMNNSTKYDDIDSEEYIKILKDLVKTLKKEKYDLIQKYEDTKQELNDCKLDLKLLREQITRQRINGNSNEGLVLQKADSQQQNEREQLIKEIELLKEKNLTLENDLKLIICQKEEFEYERDSYKSKFKLLNQFLIENSTASKQQSPNMVNKHLLNLNIDELISQNKYLAESNKNLKDEIKILNENLGKYKKQKTIKVENSDNGAPNEIINIINKREIKQLLKKSKEFLDLYSLNASTTSTTPMSFSLQIINELSCVSESLLDNLNDKHIALQHQRKCNKLLAIRIQDLENELNQIKTNIDTIATQTVASSTSLIKFDDTVDDDDGNYDVDDNKLCDLINDLASKFKLNEKELKQVTSINCASVLTSTNEVGLTREASIDDDDEDDKIFSNNNEILNINKINLNEPRVLNT